MGWCQALLWCVDRRLRITPAEFWKRLLTHSYSRVVPLLDLLAWLQLRATGWLQIATSSDSLCGDLLQPWALCRQFSELAWWFVNKLAFHFLRWEMCLWRRQGSTEVVLSSSWRNARSFRECLLSRQRSLPGQRSSCCVVTKETIEVAFACDDLLLSAPDFIKLRQGFL